MRRTALVLLGAAIATGCGSATGGSADGTPAEVAGQVDRLLAGIEERGVELGDPDARDAMTIYADPDALRYDGLADQVLPALIGEEVRKGTLRISLAPVDAGSGGEGEGQRRSAAQDGLAATLQRRLWPYFLRYARLGTGVYDEGASAAIASTVPGLDVEQLVRDAGGRRVERAAARWRERLARNPGRLPVIRIDPGGGRPGDVTQLEVPELRPGQLLNAVRSALRR
jgi:hypothetical protein